MKKKKDAVKKLNDFEIGEYVDIRMVGSLPSWEGRVVGYSTRFLFLQIPRHSKAVRFNLDQILIVYKEV